MFKYIYKYKCRQMNDQINYLTQIFLNNWT